MRILALSLALLALAACGGTRLAPVTPSPGNAPNRPPTLRARCEPCTVPMGKTATVRVEAQDPDGDPLTYTWRAPAGAIATPSAQQTPWTAPMVEGPVLISIRIEDGKGAAASDVITITVVK